MTALIFLFLLFSNNAGAVVFKEIARSQIPPLLATDSADQKYYHSPIQEVRPRHWDEDANQRAKAYCESQNTPFPIWYEVEEFNEVGPDRTALVSTVDSVAATTAILDLPTLLRGKEPVTESNLDQTEGFKEVQIPLLSVEGQEGEVWKPSVFSLLWCTDQQDPKLVSPLHAESLYETFMDFMIRNRSRLSIELSQELLFEHLNNRLELRRPLDYLLALQMHHAFPHSEEYVRAVPAVFPESLGEFKKLAHFFGKAKLLDTYLDADLRRSVFGSPAYVKDALGLLLEGKIAWILEHQKPDQKEIYKFISDLFIEKILNIRIREKISYYLTENMEDSFQGRLGVLQSCAFLVKDGYSARYDGWNELLVGHLNTVVEKAKTQEDFWNIYDSASPALDPSAFRNHSNPTLLLIEKLVQTGLDQFAITEDSFIQFLEEAEKRKLSKHIDILVGDKLENYLIKFEFSEAHIQRLKAVFPENKCIEPGYLELSGYLRCVMKDIPKSHWNSGGPRSI